MTTLFLFISGLFLFCMLVAAAMMAAVIQDVFQYLEGDQ